MVFLLFLVSKTVYIDGSYLLLESLVNFAFKMVGTCCIVKTETFDYIFHLLNVFCLFFNFYFFTLSVYIKMIMVIFLFM